MEGAAKIQAEFSPFYSTGRSRDGEGLLETGGQLKSWTFDMFQSEDIMVKQSVLGISLPQTGHIIDKQYL